MAFVKSNNNVISFANADDVREKDQRLFEQNEGLTDDVIDDRLIRSTERILSLFQATDWWRGYFVNRSPSAINTVADIPAPVANKVRARENDFTDLCCYLALYEYLLPKVADFSTEDNAERAKIGFYQAKFDRLFGELITAGDWYDFNGTGAVSSDEKQPGYYNLKRVR